MTVFSSEFVAHQFLAERGEARVSAISLFGLCLVAPLIRVEVEFGSIALGDFRAYFGHRVVYKVTHLREGGGVQDRRSKRSGSK